MTESRQVATTEDVAALLSAADSEGTRVRPVGAGSWPGAWGLGEEPAPTADASLSLLGFDDIVEYEPADLTMTIGAGVTLDRIAELTHANGQWLALDPPSAPGSTIGATIATASSGAMRTGFGGVRDHVLGLTVVTGDGRVLELGGRVVKNVAGFDLLKLMVGGWGRFGVVTQATVRLHPLPTTDITLLYEADEAEDLAAIARALATAPVVPAALRLELGSDQPKLAARIVGGAASAPVEADLLEAAGRDAGGKPIREAASASAALWRDQRIPAAEGSTEIAVHFLPTDLRRSIDYMKAAASAGWRLRCDPTEGLCALDGRGAPSEPITEWVAKGASLRVLNSSDDASALNDAQGPTDPTVKQLVQRLVRAFDPAGVLG